MTRTGFWRSVAVYLALPNVLHHASELADGSAWVWTHIGGVVCATAITLAALGDAVAAKNNTPAAPAKGEP